MHRHIAGKLTGRTTKWVVLGFWVVALVALAGFAQKLTDVQDNEASSWLPSSAESTKALDRLNVFQDENDIPTVIVYHRAGGLTQEDLTTIKGQLPAISAQEGVVGQAKGPVTSRDGEVAQSVVTYNFGKDGWNSLPDAADKLRDVVAIPGVTTYISGQGGQAADSATAFAGIDGTLLIVTLAIVILILLLTYRSPWLWLLPIISAVFALFIAEGIIYFLAKYADLTVNGQSQSILTVLVLGAGTDYALLLVARYREELRKHEDRHEAMAVALHRATPAIIARSSTVAIGMLCLMFAEMNSTAGLGPVNAIGVVVTLLVMITLLPALLVICGRWVFWPKRPEFGSPEPTASGFWSRAGARVAPRRPERPPAPHRLGLHDRRPAGRLPRPVQAGRQRPVVRPAVHPALRLDQGSGAAVGARAGRHLEPDHGGHPGVLGLRGPRCDGPCRSPRSAHPAGGQGRHRPDHPGGARRRGRPGRLRPGRTGAHGGARCLRCRCAGGRRLRHIPRHQAGLGARQPGDHPGRPGRGHDHLDAAATSARGTGPADLDGGALLRSGARHLDADLPGAVHPRVQQRRWVRPCRHVLPPVRLRVPGRARDRLQHLLDDPGAGGDADPRHAAGSARGPAGDGWGDHVRGTRARGPLRRARHDPLRVPGRARHGRRVRGHPRHADRQVGAGDGAQPRPRQQDLVAQQAGPGP